jgi:VWFA-related protein
MSTGNVSLRSSLRPSIRKLRSLIAPLALLGAALVLPPLLPAASPAPPAAGAGEGPDETYYESVDVDVVNVEVVATDRSGRAVAGLTKDDFELYEDGKPVEISNFFRSVDEAPAVPATTVPATGASDHPAAAGRAAAAKPADQVLNFAVFVDNENLTPNARRPVLAALQRFFQKHVGTGDHVILASYDGGIKVTQPAAGDPAALSAAVGKLMTGVAHGGAAIADRRRSQGLQENGYEGSFSATSPLARNSGLNAEIGAELQEDAELGGNLDLQRGRLGLGALADFITSLSGLPGRKALLVVSGAFAVETGEPLLNRLAEHANANRVTVYILGAVEGAGSSAVDAAAANPVAINATIDQVLSGGSTPLPDNANSASDALTGALHSVADRTGGLTAANLINPETFLETVRRDVSTFYSLGFSPGHKHDGKVHKLAVKAKGRRDLNLRYRETYEDRSGAQRAASETLSTLVLGVGENPLGVELTFEPAVPAKTGKGRMVVPVLVHVPLAKLVLLPQEHFHEGKLTLFIASRDDRGHISSLRRLAAPVHVANDRLMTVLAQSVGFRVEVPVRPGEQMIAVGVRDEIGHVDSTASAPWTPTKIARVANPGARPPGR